MANSNALSQSMRQLTQSDESISQTQGNNSTQFSIQDIMQDLERGGSNIHLLYDSTSVINISGRKMKTCRKEYLNVFCEHSKSAIY